MASSLDGAAPKLAGPHEVHRQLQHRLRGVEHECSSAHCCSDDDKKDGGHGHHDHVEDHFDDLDHIDMDPGMAQCCIKEKEDKAKLRHVMHAMRQVDPVARVERQHDQRKSVVGHQQTPQEWVAQHAQACPGHHAVQEQSAQEENTEDLDSDAELDKFLEDFENVAVSPPPSPPVTQCATSADVASFLATPLEGKIVKLVAFLDHTTASEAVLANLTRLAGARQASGLAAASTQLDALGVSHPLFRAEWFVKANFTLDPPFLVAFDPNFITPVSGITRHDLERDMASIDSWWAVELDAFERGGKSSGEASQAEDAEIEESYCGRPGCRTFPHEHVVRTQKFEPTYI
mmetsp:Transcript_13287/g.24626  ORF Transcript_13287/g.24626 Transcript_13287/m.24626 type:complete len:346 (+) Transcript_13287:250-1287(+)